MKYNGVTPRAQEKRQFGTNIRNMVKGGEANGCSAWLKRKSRKFLQWFQAGYVKRDH